MPESFAAFTPEKPEAHFKFALDPNEPGAGEFCMHLAKKFLLHSTSFLNYFPSRDQWVQFGLQVTECHQTKDIAGRDPGHSQRYSGRRTRSGIEHPEGELDSKRFSEVERDLREDKNKWLLFFAGNRVHPDFTSFGQQKFLPLLRRHCQISSHFQGKTTKANRSRLDDLKLTKIYVLEFINVLEYTVDYFFCLATTKKVILVRRFLKRVGKTILVLALMITKIIVVSSDVMF